MPKRKHSDMSVSWKSHFESLGAAFPEMLTGQKFVDVTLVCQGHRIHCHRVVLAASSSFFSDLFEENPEKHPIVILPQDVKFWAIQALIDFMYKGEVTVSEKGFEELVKSAGLLHIRGFNKAITSQFLKKSKNTRDDDEGDNGENSQQEDDGDDPLDLDYLDDAVNNVKIEIPDETSPETLPILLPEAPEEDEDQFSCHPMASSSKGYSVKISERSIEEVDDELNLGTDDFTVFTRNPCPRDSDNDDSMNVDDEENEGNEEIPEHEETSKRSRDFNDSAGPTKPTISVEEIKKHIEFDLETRTLEKGMNNDKIRYIVHSAHQYMLDRFGLYPDSVTKRAIAECVMKIFPDINADILFDMTTRLGMLEFRCRYFQKKALRGGGAGKYQPIKKKIAPPPPIKLNADAVKKAEENIEFLLNASLKFQKERILEAFRENFQHRQINLYSVLQDYNRILRLCPELLIQDFETKHGPTTTAWEIWESLDIEAQYATLKHVTKRKINCIIQNWSPPVARALKFMALFPPVNTDKSGKKSNLIESVQKFIMFFPEGSTPAKIKATIEKETTRPQLFAMGPNKKLSRFYVKIEDIIVPLKTDFLKSLDFFFKLHYSLDLKPDHPYFCRFMAKYIYKIDKAPLGSPVMVKLASNLNLL